MATVTNRRTSQIQTTSKS